MKVEFTIEGPPVGKARPRVTRQVTKLAVVKRYAKSPRVEVRIKRDIGD